MKNNKIILGLIITIAASSPCRAQMRINATNHLQNYHKTKDPASLVAAVAILEKLQSSPSNAVKKVATFAIQQGGFTDLPTIKALITTSEILVKALVDAAQAYHSSASAATDVQYEEAYLAVKDKSLAVPPGTKAAFDAAIAHAATQY